MAEKQKKVDTTYRQWFETKMEEERRGRREKRRETEQRETKEKEVCSSSFLRHVHV